jgi:prepilin-type processing-associated H-X9-DG protein
VRWYNFLDGSEVSPEAYVKPGSAIFYCPKMKATNPGTYGMYHPQAYEPVRFSVPMGPTSTGTFSGMHLVKGKMRRPTDFVTLFDTTSNGTNYGTGAVGWWTDRYATDANVWLAHKNTANGLFADFHVEGSNPGRLATISNYNYGESQRVPKMTRGGVCYYTTQDFKIVYQQTQ